MVEIKLNKDETKDLFNSSNLVYSGIEGKLYRYSNFTLLKVRNNIYSDIINNRLGDNVDLKNFITLLSMKQKSIMNTELPFGMVYLDDKPIGSLNRWIKNAYTLDSYFYKTDTSNYLKLIKKVFIYNKELLDHDIFNSDLAESNILVDSHENINLVDLDSNLVFLDADIRLKNYEHLSTIYYSLIKNFLNKLVIDDSDTLYTLLDEVKNYKDYTNYIDDVLNSKILSKTRKRVM